MRRKGMHTIVLICLEKFSRPKLDVYGIGVAGDGVWHQRVYKKAYAGNDIPNKLKMAIDEKIEVRIP